jgi:hypothetical protein
VLGSWVSWCTPVIPALRSLRQEINEFEDSLGFINSKTLSLKNKTKKLRQVLFNSKKLSVCLALPHNLGFWRAGTAQD